MVVHKIELIDRQRENEIFIEKLIIFFKVFSLPLIIFMGLLMSILYYTNNGGIAFISAVLGVIIFVFRKKIFKGKGKAKKNHHHHHLFSLKTLIIYGITFTIGFYVSSLILPFINTGNNLYIFFILVGLIMELSSKVCQMFLYKKSRIILDKTFVLWVLIHSVIIYGVLYLIDKITIPNLYLFFLAVGFSVAIVTHIIWRFMYKK